MNLRFLFSIRLKVGALSCMRSSITGKTLREGHSRWGSHSLAPRAAGAAKTAFPRRAWEREENENPVNPEKSC